MGFLFHLSFPNEGPFRFLSILGPAKVTRDQVRRIRKLEHHCAAILCKNNPEQAVKREQVHYRTAMP